VSRSNKQTLVGMACFLLVMAGIAVIAARANAANGLRVDVLSARRAEPGQPIDVTVSIRDTKGTIRSIRVDYGDGSVDAPKVFSHPSCAGPLSQPMEFTHAFEFIGVSTIAARVTTGGCGAKSETVDAIRTIEIRPLRR
jgi:hypothetical protein